MGYSELPKQKSSTIEKPYGLSIPLCSVLWALCSVEFLGTHKIKRLSCFNMKFLKIKSHMIFANIGDMYYLQIFL